MYHRKSYLNVKDSDIFYRCLGFKFYFCSEKRREMFIKRIDSYIENETTRIYNKYEVPVSQLDKFLAFSLYHKIEPKGTKVDELVSENDTLIVKRTFYEIPTFLIYGVVEDD